MVAGVYAATYSTANLIDTLCERTLDPSDEKTSSIHGAAKLTGTTCANMSAAIAKDAMFARMFGAASAGPMPRATFGFFALRDVFTIGASFTVPKPLGGFLANANLVDEKYASESAQMLSPIASQFVCSPLHLMALHCYNVREATAVERMLGVWKTLPQTTFVRMLRMAPAFGIGGVMNTSLVHKGRDHNLFKYYEQPQAAAAAEPLGLTKRRSSMRRRPSHSTADEADDVLASTATPAGLSRRRSTYGLLPASQVGYYPELSELVERTLGIMCVDEDEGDY